MKKIILACYFSHIACEFRQFLQKASCTIEQVGDVKSVLKDINRL